MGGTILDSRRATRSHSRQDNFHRELLRRTIASVPTLDSKRFGTPTERTNIIRNDCQTAKTIAKHSAPKFFIRPIKKFNPRQSKTSNSLEKAAPKLVTVSTGLQKRPWRRPTLQNVPHPWRRPTPSPQFPQVSKKFRMIRGEGQLSRNSWRRPTVPKLVRRPSVEKANLPHLHRKFFPVVHFLLPSHLPHLHSCRAFPLLPSVYVRSCRSAAQTNRRCIYPDSRSPGCRSAGATATGCRSAGATPGATGCCSAGATPGATAKKLAWPSPSTHPFSARHNHGGNTREMPLSWEKDPQERSRRGADSTTLFRQRYQK